MGQVADWQEGWMVMTCLALGGDPGDEADESTVEARDESVEHTTHILLPELESSSMVCK